jgi:hypothetical protein
MNKITFDNLGFDNSQIIIMRDKNVKYFGKEIEGQELSFMTQNVQRHNINIH